MLSLVIKALKHEARVLGLVLRCDHELQLDITVDQVDHIRSAIDSGDIQLLSGGQDFSSLRDMVPSEPTPAPKLTPLPKAKGK